MKLPTKRLKRMRVLLGRVVDGLGELATYEAQRLDAHLLAVKEHLAVARKARHLGELLRNQLDLMPATQARLRRDQQQRLQLLHQLRQHLSATAQA